MADVKASSKEPAEALAAQLRMLTESINSTFAQNILSPLTITLGDEFQGVVTTKKAGLGMLLFAEEWILTQGYPFRLRYVLWNGPIDTAINPQIAHGMLGDGLTQARAHLAGLKRTDRLFLVGGQGDFERENKLLFLLQQHMAKWNPKHHALLTDFITLDNYRLVAQKNNKDIAQTWRRRKGLRIDEYRIIKELILM